MIRRLAASGVKQKDIAEKTGLSKGHVSDIVNKRSSENEHEPPINSVSASAEIEALQRKLDEAEAARRSTEQRLSSRVDSPELARRVFDRP
jgi:transcriptional regulator with XRE-family HTH domain